MAARASTPSPSSRPSAWRGARRDRRPGGDGSTGQGLSLMQESLSRPRSPRCRSSCSTWPAARATTSRYTGGGHGDYRNLVLALQDVREGIELAVGAHLADKWRNPVLVYGDYLLAHTQESVAIEPPRARSCRRRRWTASAHRVGVSGAVTPLGLGKVGQREFGRRARRSTSPRRCRCSSARCVPRPATSTTRRR